MAVNVAARAMPVVVMLATMMMVMIMVVMVVVMMMVMMIAMIVVMVFGSDQAPKPPLKQGQADTGHKQP
jgi:hypothetical protein